MLVCESFVECKKFAFDIVTRRIAGSVTFCRLCESLFFVNICWWLLWWTKENHKWRLHG